ncbi:MAG: hypothetical protein ACI9MR_002793 [Myxococcota bacterium]|jgi:hypothetical protein
MTIMTLRLSPLSATPLALVLVAISLPMAGCLSDSGRIDTISAPTPTDKPFDAPSDRAEAATPRAAQSRMGPALRAPRGPLVCAEADVASDGVLVLSSAGQLEMIRGDGRLDVLRCAYEQLPEGVSPRNPQLKTADQVVVTSVGWGGWQEPGGVVVSALGTELELLWQHAWPNYNATITAVGDNGTAVVNRTDRNNFASKNYFVAADGTLTSLPEAYRPLQTTRLGALIPVTKDAVAGWLDPETLAFSPAMLTAHVQMADGRIVGHERTADSLWIVVSDGVNTSRTEVVGVSDDNLWLVAIQGDFALFHDNSTSTLIRVDVAANRAEVWAFDAPYATRTLNSCGRQALTIDRAGLVYAVFRDDAAAQTYRRDGATGVWTAIGYPMAGTDGVDVQVVGKTVMIAATAPFSTYCPAEAWTETDMANLQTGATVQLVYGDAPPLVFSSRNAQVNLSLSGRCMVLSSWGEQARSDLVDLTNGTTTPLPDGSYGTWMR